MTRVSLLASVLAFGVALAGPASGARAGLLPVSVTVTPESNQYRWTYAIVLPTDAMIRSGDYFTIYDFAGYHAGSNSQPDQWSFSSSNTGPTPDGVNPDDNPSLPNLTWRYTGPTIASGQLGLGNFWAVSDYQNSTDAFFTARTHTTATGNVDANITSTTVPVPTANGGGGGGPTTPEPATLALAGLGLPLVALARRRRKR
jgi:hypothetical protein